MIVQISAAEPAAAAEIADVAARTFPLACPPSSTPDNIARFIEDHLSPTRFAEYLADPDRVLLTARTATADAPIVGYSMLVRGAVGDADVQRAVTIRPAAELSKMYVLPEGHGHGVAAALMGATLTRADEAGANCVWLGVNQHNQRAQRFYRKHGFTVSGTRTFRVGDHVENDYVMIRPR